MRTLDLLRRAKQVSWLVACPGLLAFVCGQVDGELCELEVVESSNRPRGSFCLAYRRPDDA